MTLFKSFVTYRTELRSILFLRYKPRSELSVYHHPKTELPGKTVVNKTIHMLTLIQDHFNEQCFSGT